MKSAMCDYVSPPPTGRGGVVCREEATHHVYHENVFVGYACGDHAAELVAWGALAGDVIEVKRMKPEGQDETETT